MRERDRQVLEALARASEEHEDLAELIDLHRSLAEAQFKAKARISGDAGRCDEADMRQRMEAGVPQLTFDQLRIEPVALACLVKDTVGLLVGHNPDWAETAGKHEEPVAQELMELAREAFEAKGQLLSSASGLTTLAVGLALVPYAERAAEALEPRLDQSLWHRGYCPICGAAPDLAILDEESGARHLVCSRCSSQWRYARLQCPFCGITDHTKLQYYPSDDQVYRLYVCELCKHYLKTIDLRVARKAVLLPVERVLTVGMDVAAQGEGYLPCQEPVPTA